MEVLNFVIRSKRYRQWSETHEVIMRQYLVLCVDMQRSAVAKDGLYQYRNICKDANLDSFRRVLDDFLVLAEKKASEKTSWVKFLWESFQNILYLLKNNYLMEKIYTEVAKRGQPSYWLLMT